MGQDWINSTALLLVLLNPFLVIVYLKEVVEKQPLKNYIVVLMRGSFLAMIIFWIFALLGDAVFSYLVQAEFASFQIFGGVVFLFISVQFMLQGPEAIQLLRGDADNLPGAIAMPVLVGPGTISASVLAGKKLPAISACVSIFIALLLSSLVMILLKALHDYVRPRKEPLVQRYIDISGRITALFIGTISVDMIMRGILTWSKYF